MYERWAESPQLGVEELEWSDGERVVEDIHVCLF